MTNNDNDLDIDTPEDDFEQDSAAPKASFKESWDNNPLMKIGAVVLGAAVLFGGYMIFAPKEEGPEGKARTGIQTSDVRATPGSVEDVDQAMIERINKNNEQELKKSVDKGTSFLPTSIDATTSDTINIPEPPRATEEDPLAAWRQAANARANVDMSNAPSQDAPAEKEPDVVPMAQPVRPQQAAMKMDPNAAKALSEQMRVIIAAQAPMPSKVKSITKVDSEYDVMIREEESMQASGGSMGGMTMPGGALPGMPMPGAAAGTAAGAATATNAASKPETRLISPAGSIAYAQLLNELNSDIPGPVLAHVLSGPFAGGRALGGYKVEEEYLVLEFSVIVKEGVGYAIDGIALDEKTTLAGMKTDIDRHYFRRVILPAAAKFLEGYASAASKTVTSTTTTGGGGVVQQEEELDTEKEIMKGVEEAAGEVSSVLSEQAKRPITIKLAKGTTFGILMLKTVTTDEVGLKVGVSAQ